MKLRLFGKEAEIRPEAAVIAVSVLALLGMLIGYIFFRDAGDIIIEADSGDSASSDRYQEDGTSKDNNTGDGASSDSNQGDVTSEDSNTGDRASMDRDQEDGTSDVNTAGDNVSSRNTTDNNEGKIKIYVVGCVRNPGIKTLEKGSMICDAVREAGGLTEDADSDNINMVYSLNENVMLYIKSKKDESSSLGKGAVIVSDNGPGAEVIGEGDDAAAGADRVEPVNINTAGTDELDTLPGIGEATARDIIAYRDKYGGFGAIEDIMKVPRIKENRFESIRDYITVE